MVCIDKPFIRLKEQRMPANLCKLMVRHWAWFPLPVYTVLGDEKPLKTFCNCCFAHPKGIADEKPKKSLKTKSPRSPKRPKAQEVLIDEKHKKSF